MKTLIISLIVLMFTAVSIGANMVENGGFEVPYFEDAGHERYTDGQTIGAWTVIASSDNTSIDDQIYLYRDRTGEGFIEETYIPEGVQYLSMAKNSWIPWPGLCAITQTISGFDIGELYEIELALISGRDLYYPHKLIIQLHNSDANVYDLNYVMVAETKVEWGILNNMLYQSVHFIASDTTLDLMIATPIHAQMLIDNVSIVHIPTYDFTIQTEPNFINTVTPSIGQYSSYERWISISAEPFLVCPAIYYLDHWEGNDILDPNLADTKVLIDADKAITAVFTLGEKECGDECHLILEGDVNGDCYINMEDFVLYIANWLECTHPKCD